MKRTAIFITCALLMGSCKNNNAPDVSDIKVDVEIRRFDKFLFGKVDTNNLDRSMSEMQTAFPSFSADFITNILGLPPINSRSADPASAITVSELKRFMRLTKPLYDSLALRFTKTDKLEKNLETAFKHVKYYFPGYELPEIITYVGPLDAPSIAITADALAIGLQLYAGKDFSVYTSAQGQELYPMYISRRFEPEYIPADAMKAVAEDIFPDRSAGKPLIEQMIEKGKQWYLLNKFLPETPDTLKTGYTAKQLEWCRENEGLVWNFLIKENDIYTTEPSFIKNYIGEAPGTQGMPSSAPGNIGQWIGWRIVEAFSDKHPDLEPEALMKTEAKKIFTDSRYKPRN